MCRLYGFRANEATKVECTLVHAQNALMVQSRGDRAGLTHGHGWGVATYQNHEPQIERQAWAAYHGEHFRRAAARVYARTVLAHVRRATVGAAAIENTHPFSHGRFAVAHNGTLPHFSELRSGMLAAMSPDHRAALRGATDSEHIFRLLMTLRDRDSTLPLVAVLRAGVRQVIEWCRAVAPDEPIGLNLMLTDGQEIVGTRWGRTLYWLERDGVYDCEICGFPHIHHQPGRAYRAIVVASEPLTHEPWTEVPERSIYRVTPDLRLEIGSW